MVSLAYPIQTARLTLRPFAPGDLDDLHAYMSHPEVVRYLYTAEQDRAAAEQTLQRWMAATTAAQTDDRLVLAIVLAAGGPVMGEIMLKCYNREHQQAELGYVLHPAYHGHGYAYEAAGAMIDLGFREFGFHRIQARCDARNAASYKVMERLGLRREGHRVQNEFIKGEWTDELVYAILQTEWAAQVRRGSE